MTKFEYNKNGYVAIDHAKKAQRVVLTVRSLMWTVPVLGAVALIIFTPWEVWIPILSIVTFCGIVALIFLYGENVVEWYKQNKFTYERAKEYGVRDE